MVKKVIPKLEDRVGWLVESVTFSDGQISELSDCLTVAGVASAAPVITSLLGACEIGGEVYRLRVNETTAAEERAALENIHLHATSLVDAIRRADDSTSARLTEIAHFRLGDWQRLEALTVMLEGLSVGAVAALRQIPKTYGRVPAAVFQVGAIHAALMKHGVNIPVNRWSGSLFFRVAAVCFATMQIHAGPDHAIKKYLETMDKTAAAATE